MAITSPFEGRKVLVTGGRGFIGQHLLRRLAGVSCEVHGIVRRSPPATGGGVRWWQADLGDGPAVEEIVRQSRPDLIVHLAGYVSGARELEHVMPAFRDNLLATVGVLIAAARIGCARVVLAGSMEEPRADEPCQIPGSPYAVSKWAGSGYAQMFHALYGLPVVVLRLFMTYGPAQEDMRKLVPYVIQCALKGEPPALASGRRQVDWIYVEDVVEAIEAACGAQGVDGTAIDVGSGSLVTIREVAERLLASIDPGLTARFGALEDRPLERAVVADTARTLAAMGWKARTALPDGLERTVAWYSSRRASRPA